ncbi:MAG: outer membrane beta-barrel protein [Burkholderiales bacterium]|nr:outer membrane beta-barrel protein [Burkholderiales bacterium]
MNIRLNILDLDYKILKIIRLFVLFFLKLTYAKDLTGLYIGAGTGLNITKNSGLIKTYTPSNDAGYQYIGNPTGYSMPFNADLGYKVNNYFGVEFNFFHSGNQIYQQASNSPNQSNFWGSQNIFGLSALGFLPLSSDFSLKARAGVALSVASMTTYIGNPATINPTSELGLGVSWSISKNLAIDFDYINYGLLAPMQLKYRPPQSGQPNLGVVDTITVNSFLFSLNYHI